MNTQNERHAEIMRLTIKRYSSIVGIYMLLLSSLCYLCWPQDSSVGTTTALNNQTSRASSSIPNSAEQGTLPHGDEIETHLLLVVAVLLTFVLFLMKSMLTEIRDCRSYKRKYASVVAICSCQHKIHIKQIFKYDEKQYPIYSTTVN